MENNSKIEYLNTFHLIWDAQDKVWVNPKDLIYPLHWHCRKCGNEDWMLMNGIKQCKLCQESMQLCTYVICGSS